MKRLGGAADNYWRVSDSTRQWMDALWMGVLACVSGGVLIYLAWIFSAAFFKGLSLLLDVPYWYISIVPIWLLYLSLKKLK